MGQQQHPEYERGYHDGYQSGVNYALRGAIDVAMKSSQPSVVVTAPTEVVAAAKRELAEKALAAIDDLPFSAPGSDSYQNGFNDGLDGAYEAIKQVFTESGVVVGKERR